ncbi:unnamed protein product [Meloidogyne enterolobii]|uniref:Uncharacterized protein n=1 Tax=Meloidogyne enterolobii TaxID=390850 RepID=A0ACB1AVT8_MELEN
MVKLNFLVYFLAFATIFYFAGVTEGAKWGNPDDCPPSFPEGCCVDGCCVKEECNCMGCCGSCDGF